MPKLPRFIAAFLSFAAMTAIFASAGSAPAAGVPDVDPGPLSSVVMPVADPMEVTGCTCHVGGRICHNVPCKVPCSVSCAPGME